MDTQELTLTIYPEGHTFGESEQWTVQASIFGEWAVHEVHPRDDGAKMLNLGWQITHIPSGAIAYIGRDREQLLEAARLLSEFSLSEMRVYQGEDNRPKLPPLSLTFMRKANECVVDLDIYAVCGGYLMRPREVWPKYKRVLKRRAKEA